jgi:hypothetical protein
MLVGCRGNPSCVMVVVACMLGCERPPPLEPPPPASWSPVDSPLGSTHADPSQRIEEPRTLSARLVYDYTDLVEAVEELETTDADPHHTQLIRTLRALADVLALMERPQTAEIDAIRRAADDLEDSPGDSDWHTDYARYALEATRGALSALQLRDDQPFVRYRALVGTFSEQLDTIDQQVPLQRQQAKVAGALRTAADALLVAQDLTVAELRREARRIRTVRRDGS